MIRPGGKVVFTDWLAGPEPMTHEESGRYLSFMKFPNVLDLVEHQSLLEQCGCRVELAEDTGRFPSHVDLYVTMLNMQLTYDALKLIGFDPELMGAMRRNGVRSATRARAQDLSRQVRRNQSLTSATFCRVGTHRLGWRSRGCENG